MTIKPIPDGYHTVTPYLVVRDVAGLIDFLQQTFNATEIERMHSSSGRIMHAEVRIGDSVIMMGEAGEGNQPMPAMLYLYLEDSDAAYQRALAAGATSVQAPKDEFYGDRTAAVNDAFGNQWWMAMRVEEVTPEEMERRMGGL
jgi:PhnB protein